MLALFALQQQARPVLDLTSPLKLELHRVLGESDRRVDAHEESATWTYSPTGDPTFVPGEFKPGLLGRLSRKTLAAEKDVFLGKAISSMPLPLRGDFLAVALSKLGPQLVGSPEKDAGAWTIPWPAGERSHVQLSIGKTRKTGELRGVRVWVGSIEWEELRRKGLSADETYRTGTAKGTGWVFLNLESGAPVGWDIRWKVDLPQGRGRLDLIDELTVESSVG